MVAWITIFYPYKFMKEAPKNVLKKFMSAPFESCENVDENELKSD